MRVNYLFLIVVVLFLGCEKKGFDDHIINVRDSKIVSEMIVRGDVEIVINYYEDGDIANMVINDKENYSSINYPIDDDVQYHFEKKPSKNLFDNFPSN